VDAALGAVDPAADPVRAGLLHQLRSWYHTDVAEVLAASREAVRLVPAEPPSAERVQVLWAHGRNLATRTSQYTEAEAVLEEALTAARRAGSRPDIARAMASLGYLQAATGRTDAGVALLREACASTGWRAEDGSPPMPRQRRSTTSCSRSPSSVYPPPSGRSAAPRRAAGAL